MPADHTVLVLGDHDTTLSSLAERCRRLGHRTVRAKTPQDAIDLAEQRGFTFGVALVGPDLAVVDLSAALAELRTRCRSESMTCVATGRSATDAERERLRRAGVELALWEPVPDFALRFQLNRAMAQQHIEMIRGEERTPAGWRARVLSQGRTKAASVYSASPVGAFLVTQRPNQKGAEVAIEISLPEGRISLGAEVVYTNVPGNLRRSRLPDGMAVRFVEGRDSDLRSLRRSLHDTAALFRV